MTARIELREQPDGRTLIVRVRDSSAVHLGWVSPSGICESVVGMVVSGSALLLDVIEIAIRVCGVECRRIGKNGEVK